MRGNIFNEDLGGTAMRQEDLISAKKNVGCAKDMDDLENL